MKEGLRTKKELTIDQQVSAVLHKVPKPMADKWDEETAGLSPEEQLSELQRRLTMREKALHSMPQHVQSPTHVETVSVSPAAVREMIDSIDKGAHERIGEGKSGRVIASLRNPEVCYKVFFPQDRQPLGTNDISLEADMQKYVGELGEMYGVRSPKVHYHIANETVRAIAMERLPAVSLEDVINGREDVPAAFDIDRFFDALAKYMNALHEKDIYHRDLHIGNVLIDRDTGVPYVIDFGHATRSSSDEGIYQTEAIRSGHKVQVMLLSDPVQVTTLKQEMRRFMRRQEAV